MITHDTRPVRGSALAVAGDIRRIGSDGTEVVYAVTSATDRTVVYWTTPTRCTCPDAHYRGVTCKHQHAVAAVDTEELRKLFAFFK